MLAAATLVAWATTELAREARSAVSGLTEFLRHQFRHEQAAEQTVEVALRHPTASTAQRLAELLEQETLRDSAFDAAFRARFAEVRAIVAADQGDVTNTVSGDVSESVVQARDVNGGISFGGRSRS
ncbi:hypothetical protein F8280_11225 [Micromonospora noduli]|uniref:hypothetical protein n=1 Tax=Micromonospora noduli TaxID=709876 RepID=UPI00124BB22B|nr:hypothetical protein [Micromonospora noduli]KAB1925834.1 hypothetical protein F8280_11225 [Micromonospora noduli]